ncbi:putative 5-oxoprolinase [Nostocoides japonicum T1-X7]|uniref:Putative 5-oxoprolinase n=1 Tax=Nostocoides japonicum T1-X7 TaxID=1194083 RepID=A0A077M275_9MICO|nr:hydantoinase B/oxoprolinase family protein [Tetrasphaera japonica]CCH78285.1 putative 5-oxoprolinase [Tetrasphaera japonica T1-X7]
MTTVYETSAADQARVDRFLAEATMFLGPDPEIMRDHKSAPRTPAEEELMAREWDANELDRVRKRIVSGLDEAYEMMAQTGAAPGAKWGDLTSAVYSAGGDLVHISTGGVLAFASVLHYPVRFINKYWIGDPSVGVHDGDAFIHNDARYGNIHNTDQSIILPVFYEDELIAWVATVVHEGENGAKEPGGMPSSSESAFDDGLRMSPFKIIEKGELRRDLLTFLQNSVREPALQYQDLKVKYYAAQRIKERVVGLIDEVGRDAFLVSLRRSLEDVEAEARRRISAIPDGTYRVNYFGDGTLRENVMLKYPCAITIRGDDMTIDWRGSAPQFLNRAFNANLGSAKCGMNQGILGFLWPDLPRGISIMNSIEVLTHPGSCVDPSDEAPVGQSLQSIFKTFGIVQALFPKMTFSCPEKFGSIIAPWFNQINTFLFGGVNQHGQFLGNVCADLNGMGGGARAYRDGEPAMAPFFAAMADLGEQEIIEEDVPFLQLISKRIKRDNQAFGKYRGGMGYEIAVAAKGTPMWGFATVSSGSKFPAVPGLFGGYGCPTIPLAKIKGTNVFETLRERPELFEFDYERLMNERPFPDAHYSTHHLGMGFELAAEGEMYMICQGSGGGYGDVLERDPAAVVADVEAGYLSVGQAENVYRVVFDSETLAVDEEATAAARADEREARRRRSRPYAEFVADWVTDEPPANVPYYGSWGPDNERIWATVWGAKGPVRLAAPMAELPPLLLPDPREIEVLTLRAELEAARAQLQGGGE